jgi:tetratricopeptide (TPR) repeat protein
MIQNERIKILKQIIEQNPKDALALYALGLEYKSLGEFASAVDLFERLLRVDPANVPGYFQKAQVHLSLSQKEEAIKVLTAGILRAAEAGHLHARDKMQDLLESLAAQ